MRKSLSCSLPQSTTKEKQKSKCLVFVKSVCVPSLCSVVRPAAPLRTRPSVSISPSERGVEESGGGVISSVYGEASRRPGPGPAPPHTWRAETDREMGTCSDKSPPPLQSAGVVRRRPTRRGGTKILTVSRDYGDCVAGLLWAELGDRLGLQLPGGAPLGRPPTAPLSKPSEFSSISWMRGGMEPGISIFSVMTRSAPAGGQAEENEEIFKQTQRKSSF